MTDSGSALWDEATLLAREEGLPFYDAAHIVMTMSTLALARVVPSSLRSALVAACARWLGDVRVDSLEAERVACWVFLEEKHGTSTAIVDPEDVAVRAMICLLWGEDEPVTDIDLAVDFFASLADVFPGIAGGLH